ncbi:hypothetical protein FNV43_RR05891 [Rhamnella rubrinervis]|uniref:Secreted protein n=1 Tax=Rhamnella rubrinervis TaxID=2594499 RepID=A0A8K0MKZ2_9ROSA|nr:hypothetical protein FNV43_RR05891 [Rhamnella rubrinervis]
MALAIASNFLIFIFNSRVSASGDLASPLIATCKPLVQLLQVAKFDIAIIVVVVRACRRGWHHDHNTTSSSWSSL